MNYNNTENLMIRYLKAKIPFISLITSEKNRATTLLKEIGEKNNINIVIHSMSKGFINLQTKEVVNPEKLIMGVLDYIAEELKTKKNMVFVLTDVSEIESDTFTARYFADVVNLAEAASSSIIVITSSPIWVQLQRLGMSIELNLPDEEEILDIIKNIIE